MNLLVLTYHYFHNDTPTGIKNEDFPFSVRLSDFNNHCVELTSPDYQTVDPLKPADGEHYRSGPDRQILITIDDGHRSVEEAAEIMLRHHLKPILNVIPSLVGRDNYLTWSSLRNMALHGFSIQSHSMNHCNLTRLNQPDLAAELELSKKAIEDNIGLPVTMLAVPMGRINDRVVKTALDVGFTIIMTSYTGINRVRDDFKYLKRFQIKRGRKSLQLEKYFNPRSSIRVIGMAKNVAKLIRDRLR